MYDFSEFTTSEYENLLKLALKRFEFITYDQTLEYLSDGKPFILWRHDVDVSVHRALRLATIEKKLGVRSTYFISLHSTGYSVLEDEIRDIILEIKALGHEIGLHFDHSFWGFLSDEEQLSEKVNFEKSLLEYLLGTSIKVMSLHNPNPDLKTYSNYSLDEVSKRFPHLFKDQIAGLINTYGTVYREKIPYCSDSHGIWRFRPLKDVLNDERIKCLQVLTHPECWTDSPMSPRKRIMRCYFGRAEKHMRRYDELLQLMGRPNIDD